ERIEVVLIEVPPKLAAAFLVFSPGKTCGEKEERDDDRCDHVNAELALQGFDHSRSCLYGWRTSRPSLYAGWKPAGRTDWNSMFAQFLAHRLKESLERKLAHAIGAPVGKPGFGCDRKDINDT